MNRLVGAPDFELDDDIEIPTAPAAPGRLAGLLAVRPLEPAITKRIGFVVALTACSAGLFAIVTSIFARSQVSNWQGTFWLGLWGLGTAVLFACLCTFGLAFMQRHMAPIALSLIVVTSTAVSAGLYLSGPRWTLSVGVYTITLIFAFYLATFTVAMLSMVLIAAQFAAVLYLRPGFQYPFLQWIFMVIVLGAVGAIVGQLMRGIDEMAESERQARTALAHLNADLEFRVDEQVDELDRLGRLRRFLSPQVAEAIVDADQSEVTAPHRQLIAVLFADLRGFTHFSANTQPEDVMEVLDAYFTKAGNLFAQTGATIGGFAGDGVMAFYNDPVPHRDPAGAAVELGVRLRAALDDDVQTWRRRGYQLGIGMGVAFGYATLGLIGCEGRYDYTALGPVVNLASRLCTAAQSGEILIDERACEAVGDRVEVETVALEAKGLAEPIRAQRVVAWHNLHVALESRLG